MTETTRHPTAKRTVIVTLGPTSSASTPVSSRVSLPAEPWPLDDSYQPRDEAKPRSLPIRATIDPDTARINRQRERRTRSEDRNVLRAAVLARGAEEAGFMDDDSREGRKGRQRAKKRGAGE